MPTTNPNQYTLLDENIQPILNKSNQPFGFTIGQETSLFAISSFVLFLFLAASGVATIGRILYALGLKTANSDNEAKITTANKIITSSLFALLMSFSLVLLFLAVNPDVVKGTVDFSKIKTSTTVSTASPQTPVGTLTGTTESALRSQFTQAGVTINKAACATPSSTNCTSVAGMQTNIVNAVLQLKSKCSCDVQITGGTEAAGHSATSNHPTGAAVDIALTPQLTTFFSNTANNVLPIGNVAPCNIKYGFAGIVFWDEAPGCDGGLTTTRHFHASVTGR
ncbi:MAG: hypothetical protein NTW35_00455 [Candidatus Nomurabacteria bacterium]|nr:hypothetical protein [Candidatus Nomurabacteria bacterium]